MQAGTLNERVVFESATPTQDAVGELIDAWATFATVWARVRQVAGSERFDAGTDQVQATGLYDLTLRYRTDLTTQMRVTWRGRTMNVLSIDPQRALGRLVVRCQAVEA